ncbi:hypothetical protein [Bosea sp. 685]|uniref:hypothetical protein n=1 Tax=Bosea sp. 685 TaxID=3080057 RepID=UPI00289330DB|nr:hypothetical protein [Bosea sp. 685]WNJ93021.1 hypothetical protein RMR04_12325 [Bosea sp. 685]
MGIITCLARLCRAHRRPAAGPPETIEPPPAATGEGGDSKHWHQAKAARIARAARVRIALEGFNADQRREGGR